MTGTYELCMLIDGVIKRYPTAVVELKTPYCTGTVKALCMENPVQNIIIGNVSGALGAETQTNKAQNVSTDLDTKEPQTRDMATLTNAYDNTTANGNQTDETGDQTDENDEHS